MATWKGIDVLEVEGLVKRFGGFTAVNQVSFKVAQGEILGLIGPNGSGKSTIFNMLSGTFAPTAGSMKFDGTEIVGLAPHRIINRGIGRTFQIPRPFHRLTIFENVALAGYFGQGKHSRAEADEAAERALAMVGLPADRSPGRRARRRRPEEAGTRQGAGDRPKTAAGRREPRRARRRRDGPGRRHAAQDPRRARHHHHLGRAHHGGADARGRPRHGARPRREDFGRVAEPGVERPAGGRGLSRHRRGADAEPQPPRRVGERACWN